MTKTKFFLAVVVLSFFQHIRTTETIETMVFSACGEKEHGWLLILPPNENGVKEALKIKNIEKDFTVFRDVPAGVMPWARLKIKTNYYGQRVYSLLEMHLSAVEQISSLGR
jgi:hypothetical protein